MDRQHIYDAHVIERYLQGKLSAADEQAFEEAYLADPALLEEVQLAERLRDGLRDQPPEEQRTSRLQPRPRWLEIAGSPRYGIAASLVAAAALLSSGVLYLENAGDAAFPAAGASRTRVLPLISIRGDAAASPNVIAATDEWTVLLLDTGFADYDRYRAVLVHDGEEVLRLDDMTPTYEGMVALGLPGRLLPPGAYEIQLAGRRSDWPAAREPDELSRTPLTVTPRR
jgi:hypothetical protein